MAFPLKPPGEWFSQPEAEVPTPLTFERSGKVYGHLALWGSCHTGFLNGAMNECVSPPQSRTEYQHFHLGVIETREGEDVRVGKVTYSTNHAPLSASAKTAAAHYDHTGSVGAFVRARNGDLGIWLSGAVKSDISDEGFRDLRANPPSGDWRSLNSHLELVASLSVPVPGFPIPPCRTGAVGFRRARDQRAHPLRVHPRGGICAGGICRVPGTEAQAAG